MTTYNSYEEAQIANPEYAIFEYQRNFGTDKEILDMFDIQSREMKECDPADYCMTYNQCEEFKSGMVVMDLSGIAEINSDDAKFLNSVKRSGKIKPNWDKCFILRASALENIPTEAPEEKEVLDSIESAGEVEWKSGDVGEVNGEKLLVISHHPLHPSIVVVETNDNEYLSVGVDMLKKPETPQQREDRERLESAYDLYEEAQHAIGCIGYDDFDLFKKSDIQVKFWLAIVDKANYRKEKTHGTN